MSPHDQLVEYAGLLRIRQKAYRRDAWIIGGILFLSLVGDFVFAQTNSVSSRDAILALPLVIALGAGYATASARLEMTNAFLDLVATLQRSFEG
ncbi:MAG: hypothetical protein ABSB61_10645 [Anaerolineales bacterium]|jgi:hypothetical protein